LFFEKQLSGAFLDNSGEATAERQTRPFARTRRNPATIVAGGNEIAPATEAKNVVTFAGV
jgi:hypothetical protein